jgi:exopolysaccharide biosynthesis WecB/TagA/CpsF family protein
MPGHASVASAGFRAPQPAHPEPTFDVLGVRVHAVQIPEMIRRLEQWIAEGPRGRYVTLTNVHAIMEAQAQPAFRRALNQAASVCPDGMPLVWVGRRSGYRMPRRVYGPDLLWDFCRATQGTGYSHFFYGGAPGVAERLAAELKARFPGVRVAGCYSPPFRSLSVEEDAAMVRRINDAAPDLLWVGGLPQAGILDAGARRPAAGSGHARSRPGLRYPCRQPAPGPALDARARPGMAVPAVPGAPPSGKKISGVQQLVCGLTWLAVAVSITQPDCMNLLRSVDLLLLAKPLAALWRLRLRALGVVLGRSVVLYGPPLVSLFPGSEIKIGGHVVLCSWSRYTALGVNHATVLRTRLPRQRLRSAIMSASAAAPSAPRSR